MRSARQRRMFVILDLSAYRDYLRRHGRFAYEPDAWKLFLAFVGARCKGETALAYYALAGEVEAPKGSYPHRAMAGQLITFFREASADLRAQD